MIDRTRLAPRSTTPKVPQDGAVAAQQAQFDQDMEERAELQREANVLRDMMLAQAQSGRREPQEVHRDDLTGDCGSAMQAAGGTCAMW